MSDVTYIRVTIGGAVQSGDTPSSMWIPVSDLDLTTQTSTNAAGGLAGTLNFTLANDDGIYNELNQAVANGQIFKIEVATYDNSTITPTAPAGTLVSYAVSTGATASNQSSSGTTNANSYTLALPNISQTNFPNGTTSASAFKYGTGSGATTPTTVPSDVSSGTSVASHTSSAPDPSSLTYYAQFATAKGTYLTNANGGTWFAIGDVSSGLLRSGGATGFSQLSFNLTDQAVTPTIFSDLAAGTKLYAVQIEALSGSQVVDNTTYENVAFNSLANDGDVSANYGAYYAQHIASHGSTAGFNRQTQQNDTGTSAIATTTPTNVSAGQPTDGYFLVINGVVGDTPVPTDARSKAIFGSDNSGFVPSSATFSIASTANGSTGAGKGVVSVSDLGLTYSSQTLALHVDGNLLGGTRDGVMTLGNYSGGASTGGDDFEHVLSQTDQIDLVSGVHTSDLAYTEITERNFNKSSGGTDTNNGQYDVKNTSTTSDAAVKEMAAAQAAPTTTSADTASAAPASPLVRSDAAAAAGAPANTAYIQFRDAAGNPVQSSTGQSWFAVSAASAGFNQIASVNGSSPVSVSDLSFTIGQDAITGTLDSDLVAGTQLTAEVATYSGSSGALQSDYVFGQGTVKAHTETNSSSSAQAFSFTPTTFQETEYSSSGQIGQVSFDTTTGKPLATPATVDAASSAPTTTNVAPQALSTYVQFVGANGALMNSTGSSWFEVAGTTSGLSATTSGGTTTTALGNLYLDIGDDQVTSQLDGDFFAKTALNSVNVVTYNPDGSVESSQTYGTATVAADNVANTGGDHAYGFSYTNYGETIAGTPLNSSSAAAPAPSSGTTTPPPSLVTTADVGATSAPSLSSLAFYGELKNTDPDTAVFAGTTSGFVALPDFAIALSTATTSSATFEVDQSQAAALAAKLDGKTPATFEVAGYNSAGRSVDYLLGVVTLTSNSVDTATGLDSVTLTYKDLQEIKTGSPTVLDGFTTAQNADAPVDAPPMVCFVSGTLIRTARGDVTVERLAVGDLIETASGTSRPIRWLGHRTIDPRNHPRPHEAHPVRIAAHAFGENRPSRDLFVSPGHAICVDVLGEVLIPAGSLVNGTTIRQIEVDDVTYWHVELDSHDILLAENLPAESYLDVGNRRFFVEEGVVSLLASPDAAARTHADFCRPFHGGGPLVDAIRLRLGRRATAPGWTRRDRQPVDRPRSVEAA